MESRKIGIIIGIAGALIGITSALVPLYSFWTQKKPRPPLVTRMDLSGTYMLLSTEAAALQYKEALAEAKQLHPNAIELVFQPNNLKSVEEAFKKYQPRYAMVFILPTELDVNFAWQWLRLVVSVDDDPFVDVRTGFITGETPAAALAFVRRIRAVAEGRVVLPGSAVDNLSANPMAPKNSFVETPGNFMIPILAERFKVKTISHGTEGFTSQKLASMDGAGIVHCGGHGYPDRVVDSITSALVRQLCLAPCVFINGACYTGVTGKWFELLDKVYERQVSPGESFCLGLLAREVVGYLAALHPDHGIPVYQEMEYMATDGASLGDLIKHTQDGIMLANGGKLPSFNFLANGMPRPQESESDFQMKGTASRILFGDPALVPTPAFTKAPFDISIQNKGQNTLRVRAILTNDKLKSTFADLYHADLAANKNAVNDRALIVCKLPEGWDTVKAVDIVQVSASSKVLKSRLVAFAVEKDAGNCLLQAQVDIAATGFMESDFRKAGAIVELKVQR